MATPQELTWRPGIVVTAGANRLENLQRTLPLAENEIASYPDPQIVCVLDGEDAWPMANELYKVAPLTQFVFAQKHEPGREQPRNLGVRALDESVKQVWFLDSDLVFDSGVLDAFMRSWTFGGPGILIGPYDWGAPGAIQIGGQLEMADPRNAAFELYGDTDRISEGHGSGRGEIIGAALACFGGNLLWPRDWFEEIGGFHPELHHGRCEDGELGLRSAEHGLPMGYVKHARALHVWHPRNMQWILRANEIDVPKLNRMHPWVQNDGLRVVPEDGLRFNFICPHCGDSINTGLYWGHYATCG